MATYYKWRKTNVKYVKDLLETIDGTYYTMTGLTEYNTVYLGEYGPNESFTGQNIVDGKFTFPTRSSISKDGNDYSANKVFGRGPTSDIAVVSGNTKFTVFVARNNGDSCRIHANFSNGAPLYVYGVKAAAGSFVEYVYSTSSSAYPNGGVSGGYYYDQRATVTSPTAPSGLTYPNRILGKTAAVSWTAAQSNTGYPVKSYEVGRSTDSGKSWTVVNAAVNGTSLTADIPAGTTAIRFRVRAKDSNGQWGNYVTGTDAAAPQPPKLSVPTLAMQGQNVTVAWSEVAGADSYTLQRKATPGDSWVQAYTGAAQTFTERAGTWTSVQYRVQAVFHGSPGEWETSETIQVVSAAALVISGRDEDLGTIINDVPYSVSTDTGMPIQLTLLVNGAEVYTRTINSGYANKVLILDMAAGTGTITLRASVQASSGTVSAVRNWTYTKAAVPFETGAVDVSLLRDSGGGPQYPATVAEAIRLPGGKTLDQVTQYPAQVVTGSYVGTGTYGKSSPNTLKFVFTPKLAIVMAAGAASVGESTGMVWTGNPTVGTKTVTADGNSLSWYGNSVANQLNTSGTRYYYTVIG